MKAEFEIINANLDKGLAKLPEAQLTEEEVYFLSVIFHLGKQPNKVFKEIFCDPLYEENNEALRKWKTLDFLHKDGYIQIRRESPSNKSIAEYHYHPQLLPVLEKLYPNYFQQDSEQES